MILIKRFVNWMENGDLIPAVIFISIPHYAVVLAQYDWWPVAAVIGFIVDIVQYRSIKTFLKGNGWFWMIVLTIFSAGFHISFYELGGAGPVKSVLLGLATPAVIFALAYISKREHLDTKLSRSVGKSSTSESMESTKIPETSTGTKTSQVPDYETYTRFCEARNGDGAIPVSELMNKYGVPRSSAYKWYGQYAKTHPVKESIIGG